MSFLKIIPIFSVTLILLSGTGSVFSAQDDSSRHMEDTSASLEAEFRQNVEKMPQLVTDLKKSLRQENRISLAYMLTVGNGRWSFRDIGEIVRKFKAITVAPTGSEEKPMPLEEAVRKYGSQATVNRLLEQPGFADVLNEEVEYHNGLVSGFHDSLVFLGGKAPIMKILSHYRDYQYKNVTLEMFTYDSRLGSRVLGVPEFVLQVAQAADTIFKEDKYDADFLINYALMHLAFTDGRYEVALRAKINTLKETQAKVLQFEQMFKTTAYNFDVFCGGLNGNVVNGKITDHTDYDKFLDMATRFVSNIKDIKWLSDQIDARMRDSQQWLGQPDQITAITADTAEQVMSKFGKFLELIKAKEGYAMVEDIIRNALRDRKIDISYLEMFNEEMAKTMEERQQFPKPDRQSKRQKLK